MADLAPAHAGHTADLADRKGREVVMKHETPLLLALVALHSLRVVGGTQRGRDQRLRFAAGEQRGTMDAWEDADLDANLADLVEGAVVGPNTVIEHLFAEDGLTQLLVVLAQLFRSSGIALRELFLELILDGLDQGVAFEFGMLLGVERVRESSADLRLLDSRGRRNRFRLRAPGAWAFRPV